MLGSGSPRRLELLARLGLVPDAVRAPDVDETPRPGEAPRAYCERIVEAKLAALSSADDEATSEGGLLTAVNKRAPGRDGASLSTDDKAGSEGGVLAGANDAQAPGPDDPSPTADAAASGGGLLTAVNKRAPGPGGASLSADDEAGSEADLLAAANNAQVQSPGRSGGSLSADDMCGSGAALPRDAVVLCADTTVALGRRILGKPADEDEARAFLNLLSGRRHRVITAIAVGRGGRVWRRTSVSAVRMKRLSAPEVDGYLATGDWRGKAGGYAIQGPAAAFVAWIEGSHTGIVGLPLHETATLLQAAGLEIWR